MGMLYVVVIMLTLISFSFFLVGGKFPAMTPQITAPDPGKQEIIFEQDKDPGKENLQLQTFKVKNSCESKIAVDFLIDVSGSMRFGNKQQREKDALRAFAGKMVDDSVIGMQVFSAGTREIVPLSKYADVKNQFASAVNGLTASGNTETRNGMLLSKQKLSEVISQNKFPGYKHSLILLTDGIPEAFPEIIDDAHCRKIVYEPGINSDRCFAIAQDPTEPPNVGDEIKNLGVDIYSINITSNEVSDVEMAPFLESLLKDVASTPVSEHYYTSLDGADLTRILEKVFKDICT